MPRTELDRTVQQPLLDRLVDVDPKIATDGPVTLAQSVRALKASVRRDLEWLLNTRRTPESVPDQLTEVNRSVFTYGLPDISSMSRDSLESRTKLLRQVERALMQFEPRLARVRVSLVEGEGESLRRELHFVIEATLRLDPNPEQVVFDTVLEITSGEYQVTGGAGA
jgi:type VI secretion system protein ImpF